MNPFYFFSAWLLQWCARGIEIPLFYFFLRLTVSGREHVHAAAELRRKTNRGVLFVANHTSELDQLIIQMGVHPFSILAPLFYVARAPLSPEYERARWGWRAFTYQPWFLKLFGGHPIISGFKDYARALAPHVQILKTGRSVVIFPEGRITRETFRGEARGGAGYLIEAADPIIVPVLIEGLFKMKGGKDFWRRKRKVTLTFGTPLFANDLPPTPVQEKNEIYYRTLSERVMDRVFPLTLGVGSYN